MCVCVCVCVCVYFNNKERVVLVVKNLPANAGDVRNTGLIPGWGRSPGGEHGNTHSSILYWRIPWIEDPIGSQWVRYDWSDFAFMHNLLFMFTSLLDSNSFIQFSSVQSLSRVWLFATLLIAARQASLSITNSRVYSNSCPSSRWCHPAISSSVVPFSSCPQSLSASGSFPMSQLFAWVAKVLEFQLQHQSFQWTPRTDLL